jgi:hypothetical protein
MVSAELVTAKASDTDVVQVVADAEEIAEKYTIQVKDVTAAVTKTALNKVTPKRSGGVPFKPSPRSSLTRGTNWLQIVPSEARA